MFTVSKKIFMNASFGRQNKLQMDFHLAGEMQYTVNVLVNSKEKTQIHNRFF